MPFIPHTEDDLRQMLAAIGADSIEALFDEIPPGLRIDALGELPTGATEMEVAADMQRRAALDAQPLCFLGAGAYDHHIPAAVWEITTRGEFYSAYTPYQAEASQGTLQVIYEFQTMMSELLALPVANASLYDGASALAEAVLMAVRCNRRSKSRRVLVPRSVHPAYRRVAASICHNQGIRLEDLPLDEDTGTVDLQSLEDRGDADITALVIPQPNYFGALEPVDALADWARARQAVTIAVVNPVAMAVLRPPGEWGEAGTDIAVGEGQPLGIPLSSGGPYFGFMACRREHVRQMPGRIVGRTVDLEERQGFTLTLQPREQHIRRSKATSNICTNQGLMVTAATVHMSLLGAEGLARVAGSCHQRTRELVERLTAIDGVRRCFAGPFFHEAALRLEAPVAEVLEALAERGVLGGHPLAADFPELAGGLLVCATERRTPADLDHYTKGLAGVLETRAVR